MGNVVKEMNGKKITKYRVTVAWHRKLLLRIRSSRPTELGRKGICEGDRLN